MVTLRSMILWYAWRKIFQCVTLWYLDKETLGPWTEIQPQPCVIPKPSSMPLPKKCFLILKKILLILDQTMTARQKNQKFCPVNSAMVFRLLLKIHKFLLKSSVKLSKDQIFLLVELFITKKILPLHMQRVAVES